MNELPTTTPELETENCELETNYVADEATQLALWEEAAFQADSLQREVGASDADREEFQSKLFHDALLDVAANYDPNHESAASAATYGKRHIQLQRFNLKRDHLRRISHVTWIEALEPVAVQDEEGDEMVNPIELVPGDAGAGTWEALEDAEMDDLYEKILKRLPGMYRDVVRALYAAGGNKEEAFAALQDKGYQGHRTSFYTQVVPKAERLFRKELRHASH